MSKPELKKVVIVPIRFFDHEDMYVANKLHNLVCEKYVCLSIAI